MEQVALLSDIHGNYEALSSVLEKIDSLGISKIFCLGDISGYGPEVSPCIKALRDRDLVCVKGNHDEGTVKRLQNFSKPIQDVLDRIKDTLSEDDITFLNELPYSHKTSWGAFYHGSPKDPLWHGLEDPMEAFEVFRLLDKNCFLGHTHKPILFSCENFRVKVKPVRVEGEEKEIELKKDIRYIINPGSVGQPRDGDPRACFAVLEDNHITWQRVNYDIEAAACKMLKAGFPKAFSDRLLLGR